MAWHGMAFVVKHHIPSEHWQCGYACACAPPYACICAALFWYLPAYKLFTSIAATCWHEGRVLTINT
jgi:hypothetical protein